MDAVLGFRRLRMDDVPLLHQWMQAEHVKRWWQGPETLEEVEAKYGPRIRGEAPAHCYFILDCDQPVGYIQTYLVADWPDYARQVGVEDGTAGIDLFIGEPAYLHRGLGPRIMKSFLREIVFGPKGPFAPGQVRRCVVGPEPANRAAIRAYEKTGFHYWKTVLVEDEPEPEYLMITGPEDLEPRSEDMVWLGNTADDEIERPSLLMPLAIDWGGPDRGSLSGRGITQVPVKAGRVTTSSTGYTSSMA